LEVLAFILGSEFFSRRLVWFLLASLCQAAGLITWRGLPSCFTRFTNFSSSSGLEGVATSTSLAEI